MSTVRATRAATEAELLESALRRLESLLAEGVTTIEIKSGYGLDVETEIKMLKVARKLGTLRPVDVKTTFLGAHTFPQEFREDHEDYVKYCLRSGASRNCQRKGWPMPSMAFAKALPFPSRKPEPCSRRQEPSTCR